MQSLPRRLSHCALEGEPFECGMEYVSFLDLDGNRQDFCLSCWEKAKDSGNGYFWKGKIPLKKEKILHPDEKAIELLRQTKDLKKRFVLALYLQRKQQLKRRTQTLYEMPDTGEIFDVEKVLLEAEESSQIAQEIESLLLGCCEHATC